jgi:two-component system chemotaxis response regulator CheY
MTNKVLIVTNDDEFSKDAEGLMRQYLGLQSNLAYNIEEATERLENYPLPALLIVDLTLKELGLSPLEFVRKVRANPQFKKLGILVLTALPDPTQIKAALQAGANRYLTKQFTQSNLLPTVRELL